MRRGHDSEISLRGRNSRAVVVTKRGRLRNISVPLHEYHGGTECYGTQSVLVTLVTLVDQLPWPAEPAKPSRGRPKTYSDRLIVKALVVMIIRRLYTAYAFLAFLDQDDPLTGSCARSCLSRGAFRHAAPGNPFWPHSPSVCQA